MIKTLKVISKQEKEKLTVPRRVQDIMPMKVIYKDGIFQLGNSKAGKLKKFSKTFRFDDINYAVASREDKEAMFLDYADLLNSLDSGVDTKITINNRKLNQKDFEKSILLSEGKDGLDEYRKEYNQMLLDKVGGASSRLQEKYITITVYKKTVEEARSYFARMAADLTAHFTRLGSRCMELTTEERLRIFHDFYRAGEETEYRMDLMFVLI